MDGNDPREYEQKIYGEAYQQLEPYIENLILFKIVVPLWVKWLGKPVNHRFGAEGLWRPFVKALVM